MIDPRDWYRPMNYDGGEPGYWVTREGIVFFAMSTDGEVATQAKVEIAQIVTAWFRGEFFPRSAAPTMVKLLDRDPATPQPPDPAPAPIEIAGGVAYGRGREAELRSRSRRAQAALRRPSGRDRRLGEFGPTRSGLSHHEGRRASACAGQA